MREGGETCSGKRGVWVGIGTQALRKRSSSDRCAGGCPEKQLRKLPRETQDGESTA